MYGMPSEFAIGQSLPFQPTGPNMAKPVRPDQGTGQTGLTNALELVHDQPMPLSVLPDSMVYAHTNTLGTAKPQFSTTINTSAQRNVIPDDVFESYRLAQAKIAPYLNKMNLESVQPQQTNNPNWAEFNKFREYLANVVKTKLGVDIGNTNL